MKTYTSIQKLIEDSDHLEYGRIYSETDKDILTTSFWVISSKEAKEIGFVENKDGTMVPSLLKDFEVKNFLDTQTFQDIITLKLENDSSLSTENIDEMIHAINHYLGTDDFED